MQSNSVRSLDVNIDQVWGSQVPAEVRVLLITAVLTTCCAPCSLHNHSVDVKTYFEPDTAMLQLTSLPICTDLINGGS